MLWREGNVFNIVIIEYSLLLNIVYYEIQFIIKCNNEKV